MVCCQTKDVISEGNRSPYCAHAFGKSRVTLGTFYSAVEMLKSPGVKGPGFQLTSAFAMEGLGGECFAFFAIFYTISSLKHCLFVQGTNPFSHLFKKVLINGEELRYFDLTALKDVRYGKA